MSVSIPGSVTPPAAASADRTLSPEQIEHTRKAAQAFEAEALGQLLQPMFKTVETSKGLFGGGKGEATWRPMLVDEIAKMLAKNGGVGIADAVFKELLDIQEKTNG